MEIETYVFVGVAFGTSLLDLVFVGWIDIDRATCFFKMNPKYLGEVLKIGASGIIDNRC